MLYNDLNNYYKNKFNTKVVKLSFNGNFSCPNRTSNNKGCIFCTGSDEFAGCKNETLLEQYKNQIKMISKKWPNAKYIAYFGSFTNTYGPIEKIKKIYNEVLTFPNIIGISIATRCDCISDECLKYLEELNKKTFLTIELGLQSIHDETLKYINRGHTFKEFDSCIKKLKDKNINIVVHIINGLPNETEEMMLETIKYLNKIEINGIKIHNLFVAKNTELEKIYNNNKFNILTEDEYVNIVVKELKILSPNIVIHRLKSDPKKEDLIEPKWCIQKFSTINKINNKLKLDNVCQGIDFSIDD